MKNWSRACRLAAGSLAAVLLCACLASCATADSRAAAAALEAFAPMPSGSPPGASPQALALAKSLGRGVNFGNMLEAPTEGAWGIHLQDEFADKAVEAGFQSVRLPVRWSNHAALTGDATIDEAFARRVDHAVDLLLARGLVVVLNMHHYRQLDGDRLDPAELEVQPSVVRLRFLNLWKQIAQRYRDKPANLVFELYNEPHGEQNERWNDLAARALNVVRQTNQTRVVVIGPTHWNSADALDKLVLPNDPHLIVTVHNYQPFEFSHQGAEWESRSASWLGTPCCSAAQQAQLRAPLDVAAAWSARYRYPIYLGEFGSYGKAAMPARVAYTRLMRDEAEKRGMSWAYWEFASGFGLYDPQTRTWRTPLREALLGS